MVSLAVVCVNVCVCMPHLCSRLAQGVSSSWNFSTHKVLLSPQASVNLSRERLRGDEDDEDEGKWR